MTRYRVIHENSAGELDAFTSTDLREASECLANLLFSGSWLLTAGDTIRVEAV